MITSQQSSGTDKRRLEKHFRFHQFCRPHRIVATHEASASRDDRPGLAIAWDASTCVHLLDDSLETLSVTADVISERARKGLFWPRSPNTITLPPAGYVGIEQRITEAPVGIQG